MDAILRVEWLKSLGEVKVNGGQLTMKIGKKESKVCLTSDLTLTKAQDSFKSLMRSVQKRGEGFMLEYNGITFKLTAADSMCLSPEVQKLLDKFTMVCQPLEGLPPQHSKDHAILTKPGE